MGIILWILFGTFVGGFISTSLKIDTEEEVGKNIMLGILGAVMGGLYVNIIINEALIGFNGFSFLGALLAAAVFVAMTQSAKQNAIRSV